MKKANAEAVLAAKLFARAAFPAMRVPLEEDPKMVKKFANLNTIVEFRAADEENPIAFYIVFLSQEKADELFEGKRFKVIQGEYVAPAGWEDLQVIKLYFSSIDALNGVLKGNTPLEMLGIVGPIVKNIFKKGLFAFVGLMLSLTKCMPNFQPGPDKPLEQYFKVKMSLYLITTAMSTANKLGYEEMTKWTAGQSDRIYQFKVGATLDKDGKEIFPEIGAYLRVKAGKTMAGRGIFTRKSPFVLFSFPNPDGCVALLTNRYSFVGCVEHRCVEIIGAGDTYAVSFNSAMAKVQNNLIPSKFVSTVDM